MAIHTTPSLVHWNYYLALEEDLAHVARYIELTESNFKTHSIELVHLLLASSSEVDVLLKALCELIDPNEPRNNINDYRDVVTSRLPELIREKARIPRYGMTSLKPWSPWQGKNKTNPIWWRSYNNIKHQRDQYFSDANLKNVLNAIAALLITVTYYYAVFSSKQSGKPVDIREINRRLLQPEPNLLRLDERYYYGKLLVS